MISIFQKIGETFVRGRILSISMAGRVWNAFNRAFAVVLGTMPKKRPRAERTATPIFIHLAGPSGAYFFGRRISDATFPLRAQSRRRR